MSNPALDAADRLRQLTVLNQLRILSPCEVGWETMSGTERERHCESCVKSVHNLIEHTADEAVRLVTEPGAHVCIRIHRDAAGNVLTKDSPAVADLDRRGVLRRLALLAASWLGLAAAQGCNRPTSGKPIFETGDVCPPSTSGGHVMQGALQPPPRSRPPVLGKLAAPIPQPTAAPSATPNPSAAPNSSAVK